MSGKARILAALRRGPVRAHEWAASTPDGGKPIQRVGARINDLRNDGYVIETVETKPSALYRLVDSSPAQVCGASPADTGRLPAEPSGLIPNVATAGLAAGIADIHPERDMLAEIAPEGPDYYLCDGPGGGCGCSRDGSVRCTGPAALAEFDDDQDGDDWWEAAA